MAFYFRIIAFPLFAIIFFAGISYCQNVAPSQTAYHDAIEAELSKSPHARYLYEHADAYSRLIHLRALRNLGYDLRKFQSVRASIEGNAADTGLIKNISDNEADQNE